MTPAPRLCRLAAAALLAATSIAHAADTAKGTQLIAAVENLLGEKLGDARVEARVHWTHLNADGLVDAIVVVRNQNTGDCFPDQGVICQLMVFRGQADGFERIYRSTIDERGVALAAPAPGSLREFVHFYRPAGAERAPYAVRAAEGGYRRSPTPLSREEFDNPARQQLQLRADFEPLAPASAAAALPAIGGTVVRAYGSSFLPAHNILRGEKSGQQVMEAAVKSWRETEPLLANQLGKLVARQLLTRSVTLSFQGCNDWIAIVRRRVDVSGAEDVPLCYEYLIKTGGEANPPAALFYAFGSLGPALVRFSGQPLPRQPDDEGFRGYLAGYLIPDRESARALWTVDGPRYYREMGELFIKVTDTDKAEDGIFRRDFAVRFSAMACALRLRDKPAYDRLLTAADGIRNDDVFANGETRNVALSHWARSTEKQCTEAASWLKTRGIQ
ncbi:hypothetical protein [Zoogloea sp.]|uniref:hypothetical protein n=1 Tax=Zoogloea sp. TaxID=49181 RepID=UPI0025F03C2C|nr:hypothetical protein [Zoogloea sp.]MCK6395161.1 hypothetical protein [Zoogloea sp.]